MPSWRFRNANVQEILIYSGIYTLWYLRHFMRESAADLMKFMGTCCTYVSKMTQVGA